MMPERASPHGELYLPEDPSASELGDQTDRDELRRRYYGLLQELRVLLPGAQVLVAFLLTAPFAQRFGELDELGRLFYAVSLLAGIVSIIAFVTPTAFHRVGARTSRAERLTWAIRMTRVGIAFMAVSLDSAMLVIGRMLFGTTTAVLMVVGIGIAMALAWLILPLSAGRVHRPGLVVPDAWPHD
jgi:hypothetical protein